MPFSDSADQIYETIASMDQAYYELLQEAAFKDKAEANLTDWLVKRAHRRYGNRCSRKWKKMDRHGRV
jgi:hypothetical protein